VGPEGTQRPDLIIGSEQHAFVVDYKTGTHKNAYDKQLADYVEALKPTFKEVEGELWYI
jgi:ATP-dependent exoDNAse (exonuclease V) beta subunit